ncbi:MAG TPA: hypothetical protein VGL05_30240 [Kribbella sp.]
MTESRQVRRARERAEAKAAKRAQPPTGTAFAGEWPFVPDEHGDLLHGGVLMSPMTETVFRLERVWGELPETSPRCRGPILVHHNGTTECHGDCGPSEETVLATYHDLHEDLVPCDNRAWDFAIRRPCQVCK